MKISPVIPTRHERSSRSTRGSVQCPAAAALVLCLLLTTGCSLIEHRYEAKRLPVELQACPWQSPCAVDLTHSIAVHRPLTVDAGDAVEVLLTTGINSPNVMRIKTTIDEDGTLELPMVGRVHVAGQTPEGVRQAVTQACHNAGGLQRPIVQISVPEPAQVRVTVTGAVQRPGIYTLARRQSDLVSAIAAAGGLSRDAGSRVIVQSRASGKLSGATDAPLPPPEARTVEPVSGGTEPELLKPSADPVGERREILLASAASGNLALDGLKDGDVIAVDHREPASVVVTGMVQKPGRYELPVGGEYRVLDAVAVAQGVTYKVLDTVFVCRSVQDTDERAVIQVSLREATRNQSENILLMPGDIVSVETNARMLVQDVAKYVGLATVAFGGMFIHF